ARARLRRDAARRGQRDGNGTRVEPPSRVPRARLASEAAGPLGSPEPPRAAGEALPLSSEGIAARSRAPHPRTAPDGGGRRRWTRPRLPPILSIMKRFRGLAAVASVVAAAAGVFALHRAGVIGKSGAEQWAVLETYCTDCHND